MSDQDIYSGVFGSGVGLSLAPRSNLSGTKFSGDGITKVFTFPSETPAISNNPNSYDVIIHGVGQVPVNDYTVDPDTNSITFVEAPPAGADNIYVRIITQAVSETESAGVTISGYLTANPSATPVPRFSGIGGPFNDQAQALLNNLALASGNVQVASYEGLRAYAGPASSVEVTGYLVTAKPSSIFGLFVVDSGDTTSPDNGGTTIVDTLGRRWKRQYSGPINVKWFGAKGDGSQATGLGTDDTDAFNRAITAMEGTHDLASAYIYTPANQLYIPKGVYILSGSLVATKNNNILGGAGMYNTVLMCSRSVQLPYLMRFQGAYACQLNHMTIDGGLPFTSTATELYGADVGLVLDQVAHFSSIGLNICNTRYEGKRCIHLWESYFEDLRIFNTGFFGNATNRSAGIRFTQVGKLDNTFPGGESNNVIYNKVSFGTVGSYVSADEVPTYNIFFSKVIAEGRTWSTNYASMGETKWRVGGTASNFVIDTGYSFPHAQPFVCNATLFDFSNVGPGCRVRDYRVYQSLDNTYQEITRILSCDSNYRLDFDVSVEEVGSNGTVLINSSVISNVAGTWEYRTSLTRAKSTLFTGTSESRFAGNLTVRDSAATTSYQYRGKTVPQGVIDGDTAVRPQFLAYAIANVDGRSTGGPRLLRGLTYSRLSTGQYQFTFTQAMPDDAYMVLVSANVLNNAAERPEVGAQTATGFTVVNRAGATYYDPSVINVAVFH